MPACHMRFNDSTLPQPDHERLLAVLFSGTAATSTTPASPPPFHAGVPAVLSNRRADTGAAQVMPPDGSVLPSLPARPGKANLKVVRR